MDGKFTYILMESQYIAIYNYITKRDNQKCTSELQSKKSCTHQMPQTVICLLPMQVSIEYYLWTTPCPYTLQFLTLLQVFLQNSTMSLCHQIPFAELYLTLYFLYLLRWEKSFTCFIRQGGYCAWYLFVMLVSPAVGMLLFCLCVFIL